MIFMCLVLPYPVCTREKREKCFFHWTSSIGTKRPRKQCEKLSQIQMCFIWGKGKPNSPSSRNTHGIMCYLITAFSHRNSLFYCITCDTRCWAFIQPMVWAVFYSCCHSCQKAEEMMWLRSPWPGLFWGAKPRWIWTTVTKTGDSFTSSKPRSVRMLESSETRPQQCSRGELTEVIK